MLSSRYDVYAADVDLVDSTPPTVNGANGPLVGGGTLTGQQRVSFGANDSQSGVYGGSLLVDGHTEVSQVLDTNGGACQSLSIATDGQRSFEYAQPCPTTVSGVMTLDTGRLTPGPHSLELVVEDAAGNQTVAYNGTITVGGPSPTGSTIGPGSPAALRGAPNGTNASDQAKLTARWSGTASMTRTRRYGQVDRITGRLSTSTGQPISGALVDLGETPVYEGAKTVPLSGTRTEPGGEWALTLPRRVSSGTLRFAYRSHVNDTVAVARAGLALRVHAGIALRISPRVTSVSHRIVFTGVLHGTPIPPGGKQLVLEANSGGGWVEFDTITTHANGQYHATYLFKLPGPVAYRFRVFSPSEADFPFLDGVSNVVKVLER